MAKQLVLSNNRVLAHGEDCFLAMGGTVICTETGRKWDNATVATYDCACPADIDEVGYEYHAGEFIPCAPFGKATGGTIPLLCDDCKTMRDSGVRGDNLASVVNEGITLSFLPSIDLPTSAGSLGDIGAAEGKGKIIVTGYNNGNVGYITSNGGKTWVEVTLPFTYNYGAAVAYDSKLDLFVAIARSGSLVTGYKYAAYSKDGINWTAATLPRSSTWTKLAAGNGIFIAGSAQGYTAYSTDGINWTEGAEFTAVVDIEFDEQNEAFMIVFGTANAGSYSYDGKTWAAVGGTLTSTEIDVVVAGNGMHVLLNDYKQVRVREASKIGSSDTWTSVTLPTLTNQEDYYDISFANGMFFASSDTAATQTAVSTDGLTWTLLSDNIAARCGVFHDGGKFIGICGGANIIDSYDGINWLVRDAYRFRLPNGDDVTDIVKNILV